MFDECQINSSDKSTADNLKSIQLDVDQVNITFDVVSLQTNFPVGEAIGVCSDLLFWVNINFPPVDMATSKTLLEITTRVLLMLTHGGYYQQQDGLVMGSPPAPTLANEWMNLHNNKI